MGGDGAPPAARRRGAEAAAAFAAARAAVPAREHRLTTVEALEAALAEDGSDRQSRALLDPRACSSTAATRRRSRVRRWLVRDPGPGIGLRGRGARPAAGRAGPRRVRGARWEGRTTPRGSSGEDGLVVAADLHPQRAAMIRRGAERLGVRVESSGAGRRDAGPPRPVRPRAGRRAVLSGIGSARRRPELLWRPKKDDAQPSSARLQVAIASASAELLRPGGRLVYSVCTFPRAETDAACDAILRHRPELVPVEIDGPDGPAERVRTVAASPRQRRDVRGRLRQRPEALRRRAGYDTPRGHALRVDPVRRPRAPRRPGQAGRSACRSHPYRHHGRALRTADRAGHGGGRLAAAMHRPRAARPPDGGRTRVASSRSSPRRASTSSPSTTRSSATPPRRSRRRGPPACGWA